MLRPVIMIGCGGSGQKSVRYVRDAVRRRLVHAGWDGDKNFPTSWRFIGIDTLTQQEDSSIPYLPSIDYLSVSLEFSKFSDLNNAVNSTFPKNSDGFREMMGWRPSPHEVRVPLRHGAGQLRAVGRVAGVLALQNLVQKKIKSAFDDCFSGGPQLGEVSQRLGVTVVPGTPTPDPIIIVVGSMAGGTGAGIMLDVIDLVRRTDLRGNNPVAVCFSPDIFGSIETDTMAANSVAFMSELLSAYWDNENSDYALVPGTVGVNTRGPHATFLVGRKNLDGLDLVDSRNVYRAVGEALAAVTTQEKVQSDFQNFISGNWAVSAPENAGGFGFHDKLFKAGISSFGSSTLSIGRDRFRNYLEKLLLRSVIEHLVIGFESEAVNAFGEVATKSLVSEAKIAELARRNRDAFMSACGLQEGETIKQVSDYFVSNVISKNEFSAVSDQMKQGFSPTQQLSPSAWSATISAQVLQVRAASQKRADEDTRSKQRDWGSDIYKKVLRTASEFSATLSIPVVIQLINMARADVHQAASVMRQEATANRASAEQEREKARGALNADGKGTIGFTAGPVQDTILKTSRAISFDWKARVQDQVSVMLESVAASMLNSIQDGLDQSLRRIGMLLTSQDGNDPEVSTWPQGEVVPNSFAPSPVEFFLESHEKWPAQAKQLLERSLGENRELLPINPIHAARVIIVKGEFGFDDENVVKPFIWADTSGSADPAWAVGQSTAVIVDDSVEKIATRINAWISRPSTDLASFFAEGLGEYLSPRNERRQTLIVDHAERLSIFRQRLQEALNQSRPLMEIDRAIYKTVHDKDVSSRLNVSGFPFGENHPAKEITSEVIQQFLGQADDVSKVFSSGSTESVLISSFLEYPVNPSVISSFTHPIGAALSRVRDEGKLQSSFWLWRRARILENFIPLPDELRLAAVRGYAVARSIGFMTGEIKSQNVIVSPKGIHSFPKWLLTATDRRNLLPALLEAMVLTFGDVPTKGKAAFDAYAALIELGSTDPTYKSFDAEGDFREFLQGRQMSLKPVDQFVVDKLPSLITSDDRKDFVLKFLNTMLKNYDEISKRDLDDAHWRNEVGSVEPNDTLSLELISDLKKGFQQVIDAVNRATTEERDG
jgi:hypothetical protein